jgi:hypothetical protein
LHKVSLSSKDQQVLSKKHSKGGLISFKDAIADLQIDMVAAIDNQLKWVLEQPPAKKET